MLQETSNTNISFNTEFCNYIKESRDSTIAFCVTSDEKVYAAAD